MSRLNDSQRYQLDFVRNWVIKNCGPDPVTKTRKREIVDSKRLFIAIVDRAYKGYTLEQLGEFLQCNHATVIYHKRKFRELLEFDKNMKHVWELALGKFIPEDIINKRRAIRSQIKLHVEHLKELNESL